MTGFDTAVPGFWAGLGADYDKAHANYAPPSLHGGCHQRPVRELLGDPIHDECGMKKLRKMAASRNVHMRQQAARIIQARDIPGFPELLREFFGHLMKEEEAQ